MRLPEEEMDFLTETPNERERRLFGLDPEEGREPLFDQRPTFFGLDCPSV